MQMHAIKHIKKSGLMLMMMLMIMFIHAMYRAYYTIYVQYGRGGASHQSCLDMDMLVVTYNLVAPSATYS